MFNIIIFRETVRGIISTGKKRKKKPKKCCICCLLSTILRDLKTNAEEVLVIIQYRSFPSDDTRIVNAVFLCDFRRAITVVL